MTPWELLGSFVGAATMLGYYRRRRVPETVPDSAWLAGEFELGMTALLRRGGWQGVARVGGSGDNGADILATAPDGRLVVVQCKFTRAKVGSPVVRSVIGARTIYSADAAVVATTGAFTGPALELASEMGVECWDGAFLRRF